MKWFFNLDQKIQVLITLIVSACAFIFFLIGGTIPMILGCVFIVFAILFCILLWKSEKKRKDGTETTEHSDTPDTTPPSPKVYTYTFDPAEKKRKDDTETTDHSDTLDTTLPSPKVYTYTFDLAETNGKNGRASRQTICRRIYWKDGDFKFPHPLIVTIAKTDFGYDVLANSQKIGTILSEDVTDISLIYDRIIRLSIQVEHNERDDPYTPSLVVDCYSEPAASKIPGFRYRPRGQRVSAFLHPIFLDEYVVIDLETTGIDPYCSDILEVAAIHVKCGKIVDQFSELCHSDKVTAESSSINNISSEMVRNARKVWDVLDDLSVFIADLPIVGHNLDFDLSFIAYIHPISNVFEDTCILADEFFMQSDGAIRIQNRKLETVCDAFKIKRSNAHRALGDCIDTFMIYEKMKEYLSAAGDLTTK